MSQQLGFVPQQALPPDGAVQWLQSDFTAQLDLPLEFVLKQVTKPALPQMDLA